MLGGFWIDSIVGRVCQMIEKVSQDRKEARKQDVRKIVDEYLKEKGNEKDN